MTRKVYAALFVLLAIKTSTYAQQKEIPVDTTYNVDRVYRQVRKDFPMAVPARDSLPAGVIAERNIVYATLPETPFGKRDLHLELFRPQKKGKYPAIIMIHGGGWRSGTRFMQVPMAQMLAAKGFVTIPVEYQLSLEAKYPAAVHNIKAAIRYIKANADKYNIDTTRLAVSGCSAGGQLAALIGFTGDVPLFEGTQGDHKGISTKVHAIVDIDGVLDFLAPNSLNLQRKADAADVAWFGGTFEEKPATWKEASGIFWASEKTAVPTLFLNSGFPRFHAGQDELIAMMKLWNVKTAVHAFDLKMHPFWLFHPWVEQVVEYEANFLNEVLPHKN